MSDDSYLREQEAARRAQEEAYQRQQQEEANRRAADEARRAAAEAERRRVDYTQYQRDLTARAAGDEIRRIQAIDRYEEEIRPSSSYERLTRPPEPADRIEEIRRIQDDDARRAAEQWQLELRRLTDDAERRAD